MSDSELSDEDIEWIPSDDGASTDDGSFEEELSEDISDDDEQNVSGGWNLLRDPFSDVRPEDVPTLTTLYEGINEALEGYQCFTAYDAFILFFSDEVMEKLCQWTNEKAEIFFNKNPAKNRKTNGLSWKQVSKSDMYTFLALVLAMGLNPLPRMHDYWAQDWVRTGPPLFCAEVMSRDRFFSILKFLRFSPPAEVDKSNPRTRIEPFLCLLRENSQMVMRPGRHVAVDEALVLWKGRLHFRQYIKSKRARFGLKLYVLCPSDEAWKGFSWNVDLYYGKDSYQVEDEAASHLSVSERTVVFLMKDLLDEGRHVITDNWYTSLRLATYLEQRKTMLTGVVRYGRGPPREVKEMVLEKHQTVFARKDNVLIVKWVDKKDIVVLTTKYNAGLVERTKTFFGNRTVFYNKPLHIEKYNEKMGSVDLADQLLEPYAAERKSLHWAKKLAIHMVFRMVLNAHIAYKNLSGQDTVFLDFITSLIKEILLEHNLGAACLASCHRRGRKLRKTEDRQVTAPTHQFVKWEDKNKKKRCRMCYPKRRETRYYCSACEEKPGLCSMEHFNLWHNKLQEQTESE